MFYDLFYSRSFAPIPRRFVVAATEKNLNFCHRAIVLVKREQKKKIEFFLLLNKNMEICVWTILDEKKCETNSHIQVYIYRHRTCTRSANAVRSITQSIYRRSICEQNYSRLNLNIWFCFSLFLEWKYAFTIWLSTVFVTYFVFIVIQTVKRLKKFEKRKKNIWLLAVANARTHTFQSQPDFADWARITWIHFSARSFRFVCM